MALAAKFLNSGWLVIALVAFIVRTLRSSFASFFLGSLKVYLLDPKDSKLASQPQSSQGTDGKGKKEKKQPKQLPASSSGSINMRVNWTGKAFVQQLDHIKDFENLIYLVTCVMLTLVYVVLAGLWYKSIELCTSIFSLVFVLVITATVVLAKVELDRDCPDVGLGVLMAMGGVTFLCSHYLLALGGAPGLLGFDAKGAADSLGQVIRLALARNAPLLGLAARVRIDHHIMSGLVSALAGVIGALLLAPASRYAKLLYLQSNVPPWASAYLAQPRLVLHLMRLGLLLPLAAALLAFQPLRSHWGVPPGALQYLQPGLYIATALVHIMVLPHMCQTFLDSALRDWHVHKHNGRVYEQKAVFMDARARLVAATLTRVAIQVLILATYLLGFGAVLLVHGPVAHHIRAMGPDPMLEATAVSEAAAAAVAAAAATAAAPAAAAAPSPSSTGLGLEGLGEVAAAEAAAGGADGAVASSPAATALVVTASHLFWIGSPFFHFVASYLAWWAVTVWCIYSYFTLAIYRLAWNQD